MSVIGTLHSRFVFGRRSRVLASHLGRFIPPGARVLDVGCGDGLIDRLIMNETGVTIEGIDTLVRPRTHIPVQVFDGKTIPHPDLSFDTVMFVDVLHHTENPADLLAEAARVGRSVLIKDHLRKGFLARPTLRLMDWVGNAHHGVALSYNYLSWAEWNEAFKTANLRVRQIEKQLDLYPTPFSWVFDRNLHFIALCDSPAV